MTPRAFNASNDCLTAGKAALQSFGYKDLEANPCRAFQVWNALKNENAARDVAVRKSFPQTFAGDVWHIGMVHNPFQFSRRRECSFSSKIYLLAGRLFCCGRFWCVCRILDQRCNTDCPHMEAAENFLPVLTLNFKFNSSMYPYRILTVDCYSRS